MFRPRWLTLPTIALLVITIALLSRAPRLRSKAAHKTELVRFSNSSKHNDAVGSHPVEQVTTSPVQANNYTRRLVIPKLKHEDTTWLEPELTYTSKVEYIVNDPTAAYHPPINKGNEVMIYLTYVIEHYDDLPDISIFIHSHRYAWHNNDLLDNDMTEMLRHLNNERVIREGYMNLRCQWGPGCPHWLRPRDGATGAKMSKQEQLQISKVWHELFPSATSLPEVLSGPCCAQFAASRDAVRRLPLERYVEMRKWVMRTELSDFIVGRCFEYLWQYVFTGREEVCPDQHVCHCDGYGLCFEDNVEYQRWFEIRYNLIQKVKELNKLQGQGEEGHAQDGVGPLSVARVEELRKETEMMESDLAERKAAALRRGKSATIRAEISRREWKEGDASE